MFDQQSLNRSHDPNISRRLKQIMRFESMLVGLYEHRSNFFGPHLLPGLKQLWPLSLSIYPASIGCPRPLGSTLRVTNHAEPQHPRGIVEFPSRLTVSSISSASFGYSSLMGPHLLGKDTQFPPNVSPALQGEGRCAGLCLTSGGSSYLSERTSTGTAWIELLANPR